MFSFKREIKLSDNFDQEYWDRLKQILVEQIGATLINKIEPAIDFSFVDFEFDSNKFTIFIEAMDGTKVIGNKRIVSQIISRVYEFDKELLDEDNKQEWRKYLNK